MLNNYFKDIEIDINKESIMIRSTTPPKRPTAEQSGQPTKRQTSSSVNSNGIDSRIFRQMGPFIAEIKINGKPIGEDKFTPKMANLFTKVAIVNNKFTLECDQAMADRLTNEIFSPLFTCEKINDDTVTLTPTPLLQKINATLYQASAIDNKEQRELNPKNTNDVVVSVLANDTKISLIKNQCTISLISIKQTFFTKPIDPSQPFKEEKQKHTIEINPASTSEGLIAQVNTILKERLSESSQTNNKARFIGTSTDAPNSPAPTEGATNRSRAASTIKTDIKCSCVIS